MAIDTIQPQGAAPVAPAAPAAPAPEAPAAPSVPPEVANLPVIQAITIGQPAAVYVTEADKDNPVVPLIAQNAQALPSIGVALFADETKGVLFNPEIITPQEVAEAVKDDNLDSIAIPLGMLEQAMNDIAAEDGGAAPPVGGATAVPPATAGTKRQINSARLQNLKPKAPTEGSKAGQGIVNELTRPVV